MIEKTLCLLAAIAILVTGAVHLELWLWHGYRGIPTVGTLFLLNAISAAVIAVGLIWRGGRLIELAGLGYAATTLAAFFISVYHGLFGFIDTLHGTPQAVAGFAEAAAIVLLAGGARSPAPRRRPLARRQRLTSPVRTCPDAARRKAPWPKRPSPGDSPRDMSVRYMAGMDRSLA